MASNTHSVIANVNGFHRFGAPHWVAMATIAAAAFVAIAAARRERGASFVRIGLSLLLAATMVTYLVSEAARGTLTGLDFLPFHLSDFAVFLAIFALLTRRQRAAELLYFLAIAELLAILTPDVERGLRDPRTMVFFMLHGGTLVAALALTFGFRLMPEKGAVVRTLLFLNGYAGFAALVNLALGTNFLYLRQKPAQSSPLDWMGPWPWYLLTAEIVALVLFSVMYLPFRRHPPPAGSTV